MKLTARDLLLLNHVEIRHGNLLRGKRFTGVSTDSRLVQPGQLFVALRGERFDGHAFVRNVVEKGVSAVLVERLPEGENVQDVPVVVVSDTLRALGELARLYRRKFSIPVLAIAGSNGKTTTKELVASVLGRRYNVLRTGGNLNNHIGVPLTLFRLKGRHELAVIEIGTNHPGEIASLCRIVEPTHGLLTNIGKEHLEFLGSIDGVAAEEGALFDSLALRTGSTAFVNADDRRVIARAKRVPEQILFGFGRRRMDVRGIGLRVDTKGCPRFQFLGGRLKNPVPVALSIPGRHNASNALAAAAVGIALSVPAKEIQNALETFRSVQKRMEVIEVGGVTIFNDTYNANPDSMQMALQTFARSEVRGKKIAVLADMRELGAEQEKEHSHVGEQVARLGIEYLLTYGELARHMCDGLQISFATQYDRKNVLAEYLVELVEPGDAVLVKGSRVMQMEDIVTFLVERLRTTKN